MAGDVGAVKDLVFSHSSFAIVRSETLDDAFAKEIEQRITLHGGNVVYDNYPETRLKLDDLTHIITTTFDFPDYYDALEQFKQIVRPDWVEASVATGKLAHPRKYSPDPNLILSDVVATCADLPDGDKEAIIGGVLAMGGNYSTKLTTMVTHIVALDMNNEKVEQAISNDLDVMIVLPHWFDQCLKLGKRIDEEPYSLPDASIISLSRSEIPRGKPNTHVSGATSSTPSDDQTPSMGGRKSLNVFKSKRIMLDADLKLSPQLRDILNGIILAGGGRPVDKMKDANVLVCKYRAGDNYTTALRKKIDVGSLSWLYYLIVHDIWTSPYRRLLHHPVPKEPISGFEGLKISLSNYNGEARTYLENLITATGAECTKTLKQENTHLVTAHSRSDKVDAAREWNVSIVNHLWIEESYARWEMQTLSNSRYSQFPAKTNLGEVVGQTYIDRTLIERVVLAGGDSDMENVDVEPRPAHDGGALDTASPAKTNMRNGGTRTNAVPTGLQTPATSRVLGSGKENVTPSTTGSRRAKAAAAAKLHEMTPDIASYEKERKRVGGVVYGGRRGKDDTRVEVGQKRSAEPEIPSTARPTTKKQRTDSHGVQMHLLISGYKPWIGKPKKEDEELDKLRSLGIVVVTEPGRASHLAVPKIVRTPKFLTALAFAPMILSTDFIDACLAEEKLLDPEQYKLNDKAYEKKQGFSLQKALKNAESNDRKLLDSMDIFCTEKIEAGFETLADIATANGTTLTIYRGRHMTIPSRRAGSASDSDDQPDNGVFLISNMTDDDKRLWPKFIKTAQDSRRTPYVVSSEWLLSSALRQQVEPVQRHLLKQK